MPALYWCGRRWRTSSDDFFFSGIFFFVIAITNSVILFTRFLNSGDGGTTNSIVIHDCPKASKSFLYFFFALGVTNAFAAVIFIVTAFLSFRGGPFQFRKRRHVPFMLYLNALVLVLILVLCLVLVKYALVDKESRLCVSPTRDLLYIVLAFDFFLVITIFIMYAVVFDPDGRSVYNDFGEYESVWRQRCRMLCCCCLRPRGIKDPFAEVARTFASLFYGYDIVPSDIVAGVLLIHGVQKNFYSCRRMKVKYPSAEDGVFEYVSLQARRFPFLTAHQKQQLSDLRTYSRFFLGSYGWALHEYMNCCTGSSKLCCFDPLMCCREHPGIHKGTKFYCDLAALLKFTGLNDEDIILTNWKNSVFEPVFFVAVDHSTNAIVVAIRGTMSFVDCLTDMVTSPCQLKMPNTERDAGTTPEDYFVHGGMMQSAAYVLSELQEYGVLGRLIDGDLRDHKLVVLGHSLGAGVASILSIMLWSTQLMLRNRFQCLAYSPPGGLLSDTLVNYSKDFIIGCFAGNDVVPRMALHTLDALRNAVLKALMETTVPKSLIFLNLLCRNKIKYGENGSSLSYLEVSRASSDEAPGAQVGPREQRRKLYPPATLVHYCKAVVRRNSKNCAFLNCCNSCACCKEEVFVPMFETPSDVQYVVCARSMFRDHFPDHLFSVIEKTGDRLNRGELQRFFFSTEEVGKANVCSGCGATSTCNETSYVV